MQKILATLVILFPVIASANGREDTMKRIRQAGEVFSEIMSAPDRGIPQDILDKAQCIGIVPNLKKGGFIVGAKYGKGVLVCRTGEGWSAPDTIAIEGGSVGFQIGAGETDVVFVVMNKTGQEHLMQDKFTFGGNAAAMAGPVGRDTSAQTDAMLHAEILSYSRSRGLFAGISLEGSTLRPAKDDNRNLYGRDVTQREILTGAVQHPAGTQSLYSELNRFAPTTRHTARR